MPVPTSLFPVAESFSAIGREIGGAGVAPTTFTTIPVAAYEPEDLATWLDDKSLRGSMVPTYDVLQGPIWAGHTIPSSFVYPDTIGHILHNLFGDYSATGAAVAPNTTLTAPAVAGATTLTVAVGTSFTVGMFIQISTAAAAEIVKVLSGASTSITLDPTTPLRLNHASSDAVTNTAAPYVHLFSTQNPGYTSGAINGQPPSHTWIHRTQIPTSGNKLAVQYAYWCLSDFELSGNAMGACVWNGKSLSFDHAYPSALVAPAPSAIRGQPAWQSKVGIAGPATGGTQVFQIAEWQFSWARSLEEYLTAQGSQAPYVFGRGPLGATFKLMFSPTIDESALTLMLNNTQPQVQVIQTNGLGGAAQQSIQIDALLSGFKKSKLSAAKNLFGYDVEGELIANTTNAGNSLGYSTSKVTLTNAVPTY
jgi:hypothetical protein